MVIEKDARFLVTGLNGLIGWHLFQKIREYYSIFGTYRKRHTVFEGDEFFRIDLEDHAEVKKLVCDINPDYLIHAWSICDLDVCESLPDMAERINVQGTKRLLDVASGLKGLKKFIYISTDHVFSGETGSYNEFDQPQPKHVYGRTKHAAEKLVENSGLPHLIIRPGLVIGESFQGNKGPRDFLFSRIDAGKPTHLFTDEWRTPIAAEKLSSEIVKLVEQGATGTYHLAGDTVVNRFELARELATKAGLSTKQIFPRLRKEDEWAHIRPFNLSLKTKK